MQSSKMYFQRRTNSIMLVIQRAMLSMPNFIRVSQQVLEELELSRDTIEINDNTNKKVNTTEKNRINTKNENKHGHKHKIRNANDNNNNKNLTN